MGFNSGFKGLSKLRFYGDRGRQTVGVEMTVLKALK